VGREVMILDEFGNKLVTIGRDRAIRALYSRNV
jgi:hypothetical protein